MTSAAVTKAAVDVERARTTNVLIDAARLESVLASLVAAEGVAKTLERVEHALQSILQHRMQTRPRA